jgi:hypothetical protein
VLLSLWMFVTNLFKMKPFKKLGYMRGRCAKGIFSLCCNLFDFLFFDRKFLGQGYSGCSVLLFSFLTDCEEAKFCSMRYYLPALFRSNSSFNYLWYSVDMTLHRNNDTMGSRLINNMVLPHIWLAQENITYI